MEVIDSVPVKCETTGSAVQEISRHTVNQTYKVEKVRDELKTVSVPKGESSSNTKQERCQEVAKQNISINNRTRRPCRYIIVPAPRKVMGNGIMQPFSVGTPQPWGHYRHPFNWSGNCYAMMNPRNAFAFPRPRPLFRPVYKFEGPIRPSNTMKGHFTVKNIRNEPLKCDRTQVRHVTSSDVIGRTTKLENNDTQFDSSQIRATKVENTQDETIQPQCTREEKMMVSSTSEDKTRVFSRPIQPGGLNDNGNMQFWNTLGITSKLGGAAEEIAKCALRLSNELKVAKNPQNITNESTKIGIMLQGNIKVEGTSVGEMKMLDWTEKHEPLKRIKTSNTIVQNSTAPNQHSVLTTSLEGTKRVDCESKIDAMVVSQIKQSHLQGSIQPGNTPDLLIKLENTSTENVRIENANHTKDMDSNTVQPSIKPERIHVERIKVGGMLEEALQGVTKTTALREEVLNGMNSKPFNLFNETKKSSSISEKTQLSSSVVNNKSVYKSIQLSGAAVDLDSDHLLPGTDLVYRTPGANKVNKKGNIKRPMNAFMVWARTYRARMAEVFPRTTNSEVSIRLGQVWNEMSSDQKRPYYMEAERIKQRHRMQYPEWCYTPTPAQRRPQPEPHTTKTEANNIYWGSFTNATIIQALPSLVDQVKTEPPSSVTVPEKESPDIVPNQPARITGSTSDTITPQQCIVTPYAKPAPIDDSTPNPVTNQPSLEDSTPNPVTNQPMPLDDSTPDPMTNRPTSLDDSTRDQIKIEPLLTTVYQSTLTNTPFLQSKGDGLLPVVTPGQSTLPPAVKLEKPDTLNGKPETETKTEPCTNKANCQCFLHRNSKKRPRKPRVRRKDREKQLTDTKSQTGNVGKRRAGNMTGVFSKASDKTRVDKVHPVDPYNPFYLLNLEHAYDETTDDVDIDSWQTYLGDSNSLPYTYSQEPGYNLDVFLSEARVSQSATSLGSSDIEILPTPVANTLDRLQDPPTSSKLRNKQVPDLLDQFSLCQGSAQQHSAPSESVYVQKEPSPSGNDMFVINEEIVVTTPLEPSVVKHCEGDTGGAGDSFTIDESKSFHIHSTTQQADSNHSQWFGSNLSTVSPPGKRLCM